MKDDDIEWASHSVDWSAGYAGNLSYAVTHFGVLSAMSASELIRDIQSLATAQEYA